MRVTGEHGSAYDLTVTEGEGEDGLVVERRSGDLGSSGRETLGLLLSNGDYTVAVVLTDDEGNASEPAVRPLSVAVDAPEAPEATLTSDRGRSPLTLRAEGVPFATVVFRLQGASASGRVTEREAVELDEGTVAEATFDVPDGEYRVVVELEDFQGQPAPSATLRGLHVKEEPPSLDVRLDPEALADGRVVYAITSDPGVDLSVRVGERQEVERARYTEPLSGTVETGAGEFAVVVTAVDEYGNETVHELLADVSVPASLLGLLVGLALIGAPGYLIFRKRRVLSGWWRGLRGPA